MIVGGLERVGREVRRVAINPLLPSATELMSPFTIGVAIPLPVKG
jgi:hypothetical protein